MAHYGTVKDAPVAKAARTSRLTTALIFLDQTILWSNFRRQYSDETRSFEGLAARTVRRQELDLLQCDRW